MNERITYDVDEIRRLIDQELDELRHIRFSEGYTRLLGEDFMRKVKKWENAISVQKDLPYTIVVCGSFKRGKSTLINALLGEDVVTTDVTSETITLNRISYGEHSNALVLENGRRMLLTDQQLHRDALEEVLASAGEGHYQLDLRRPIELLKKVTIIDTPGVDDALSDFDDMVNEALMQADAVIYVFSSSYPLSMQEQMFLRTVILPQAHTELFLVSNYADVLRDAESCEKMWQEIEKRIALILPGQPFYMLSALDERCRQLEVNRPNPQLQEQLEASFAEFSHKIDYMVEAKNSTVLLDRMERMLKGMRGELNQALDTIVQGLQTDKDQLYATRQNAQEELAALEQYQNRVTWELTDQIRTMFSETLGWMSDLVDQMRSEAQHLDGIDANNIRKYYSLYCVDTLQKAMNRCTECHYDSLLNQLDQISDELSRRILHNRKEDKVSFRFAVNNKTWTKGDSLGFFVNGIGGVVGIMGMTIAGTMRQRELKNTAGDVLADIQEQYDRLIGELPGTVKRVYDNMEQQTMTQVKEYFSDQSTALQEKTEQITLFAQRSAAEKEESMGLVREVRQILEQMVV